MHLPGRTIGHQAQLKRHVEKYSYLPFSIAVRHHVRVGHVHNHVLVHNMAYHGQHLRTLLPGNRLLFGPKSTRCRIRVLPLNGVSVAQTVQRVPLMDQTCFFDTAHTNHSGRFVRKRSCAAAVEDRFARMCSCLHPCCQRIHGIDAELKTV